MRTLYFIIMQGFGIGHVEVQVPLTNNFKKIKRFNKITCAFIRGG